MGKIRVYSFSVENLKTNEVGTMFITAKSADEANSIAVYKTDEWRRCGYIGPVNKHGWQPADFRLGFVSMDVLEAERRAEMPVQEHDPKMLAEFVERTGRQPQRGNVLKRNLLSQGVFEIDPNTSSYCDPSTESYHSM